MISGDSNFYLTYVIFSADGRYGPKKIQNFYESNDYF